MTIMVMKTTAPTVAPTTTPTVEGEELLDGMEEAALLDGMEEAADVSLCRGVVI
jgi:hypothetical protein